MKEMSLFSFKECLNEDINIGTHLPNICHRLKKKSGLIIAYLCLIIDRRWKMKAFKSIKPTGKSKQSVSGTTDHNLSLCYLCWHCNNLVTFPGCTSFGMDPYSAIYWTNNVITVQYCIGHVCVQIKK